MDFIPSYICFNRLKPIFKPILSCTVYLFIVFKKNICFFIKCIYLHDIIPYHVVFGNFFLFQAFDAYHITLKLLLKTGFKTITMYELLFPLSILHFSRASFF